MNILLIGEAFSANLGDAVICQTEKKILEEYYPDANVVLFDMSGKVDFNKYYRWGYRLLKQRIMLKLFSLCFKIFPESLLSRAYFQDDLRHVRMIGSLNALCKKQKFDLVIFAGGELFMDYFAGIIYLIVGKMRRSKIIFHACGMGLLNDTSIELLRKSFEKPNVVSITLRDSYERFVSLFGNEKLVAETYDIALNCSKYYIPSEPKIADYGIGVIDIQEYFEFQKELIKLFMNSQKSWKIFLNGSKHDENVARSILNELGVDKTTQDEYVVKCPEDDKELIHTVTKFRNIVSFRMHSQIVASAFGIPSYGIVWDEKIKTFYRKIQLPQNCYVPTQNISNMQFLEHLKIDKEKLLSIVETQARASKNVLLNEVEKIRKNIEGENSDS